MEALSEIIKKIEEIRENKYKLILLFCMALSGIVYVYTEDYSNLFKFSAITTIVAAFIIVCLDTKKFNSLPRNKDKDKNAIQFVRY